MATGYTSELKALDYDVKRWLKARLVRGLGVCIMLRDDRPALTEEEIRAQLQNDSSVSHYQKALLDAKKEMAILSELNDLQWQDRLNEEKEAEKKRHEEYVAEWERERAAFERAAQTIARWNGVAARQSLSPKEQEFILSALRFAGDQIGMGNKFDYSHRPAPSPIIDLNVHEYRGKRLKELTDQIDGCEANLARYQQLAKERLDYYNAFCKFIDAMTP